MIRNHTSTPYSARLPPSDPIQNLVNITIACAIISWGSRSSIPAAWVSLAPANCMEFSRSAGMPSSWDPEDEICSAVAREFANWEVCMAARMISRSLNSSFGLLDVQSYLGAEIGELNLPRPYSAGSRHFTFCRLRLVI